jgi:hypothetical protein
MHRLQPTFLRPLAAAALSLALAAPAQAALVQGDWDPPFGAPFPQLGWRGTATLDVPLACLALSGTIVNDTLSCPLMTVVGATVEFYDLGDLSPVPATVEVLDFDAFVAVDRIFVNAGQVEGFALDSTGRVLSTSPLGVTVPGGDQAFFGLEIDFVVGGDTVAVLSWYEDIGNPANGRNDPAFPAIVRISQFEASVPVPATLALALAGLALMGGLRRRG